MVYIHADTTFKELEVVEKRFDCAFGRELDESMNAPLWLEVRPKVRTAVGNQLGFELSREIISVIDG